MADVIDAVRQKALEQAVIFVNAKAHAVRETADEVVNAARKFEAFLAGPEPDNPA